MGKILNVLTQILKCVCVCVLVASRQRIVHHAITIQLSNHKTSIFVLFIRNADTHFDLIACIDSLSVNIVTHMLEIYCILHDMLLCNHNGEHTDVSLLYHSGSAAPNLNIRYIPFLSPSLPLYCFHSNSNIVGIAILWFLNPTTQCIPTKRLALQIGIIFANRHCAKKKNGIAIEASGKKREKQSHKSVKK